MASQPAKKVASIHLSFAVFPQLLQPLADDLATAGVMNVLSSASC
jgi:hypothetical protein